MRGGLLRASAMAYLGKHLAMKDWLVFAELFGMPVRIARYEPSATPEEKRELLKMLESLRSDAAGVFSKAVELQLLEAGSRQDAAALRADLRVLQPRAEQGVAGRRR